MQFGRAFPRILQEIWEADPDKLSLQVLKIDVTGDYHCGALRPYQVGAFTYIVPLAPIDDCIIICIDLVLLMGWVDSPKFFCDFSETLADIANALVDTEIPIPAYVAIAKI